MRRGRSSSYCHPGFLEHRDCVKPGTKVHLHLGLPGFFRKKMGVVSSKKLRD